MIRIRTFLLIGVIGALSFIAIGVVWLGKGGANENNQPAVLSQTGLNFESAVGQKAPDFILTDIEGNQVALGNLSGRNVVFFFTEGFMCNPCFTQLLALSTDERLNNNETVSFSIVVGDQEKWHNILADLPPLPPLKVLFDTEGKVSQSYGTLNLTSSMHKGLDNGHTYFIVDRQGILRFTLDDPIMGLRNDQLVAEVEKLKTQ